MTVDIDRMHEITNDAKLAIGTQVDIMLPLNMLPPDRMRPMPKKIFLSPGVYESIKRHDKIVSHGNKKTVAGTIKVLEGVPVEEREMIDIGYVLWQVRIDGLSADEREYVEMYRVYSETAPR